MNCREVYCLHFQGDRVSLKATIIAVLSDDSNLWVPVIHIKRKYMLLYSVYFLYLLVRSGEPWPYLPVVCGFSCAWFGWVCLTCCFLVNSLQRSNYLWKRRMPVFEIRLLAPMIDLEPEFSLNYKIFGDYQKWTKTITIVKRLEIKPKDMSIPEKLHELCVEYI